MSKEIRPYGTWPSPISAKMMGQRFKYENVQWTLDGNALVWVENRSGENILVKRSLDDKRFDLFQDHSARGGVLYGGGELGISLDSIIFVNRGRQLYRCSPDGGDPTAIAPPFGALAAPTPSPDGKWIVYVFSDGQEDLLAITDAAGEKWPVKLAAGADFYMQPCWHPNGNALAWVEWDHPNMPWDATRIMIAIVSGTPPAIVEKLQIAGDGKENVTQPSFSPDGRWLSFIASQGEWERLMVYDLTSRETRVLLEGDEILISTPAWVQGTRTTAWSYSSERIFAILNYAGRASLVSIGVEDRRAEQIATAPYTWLKQISASPIKDELAAIASSPQMPEQVVRWDGQRWNILTESRIMPGPPELYSYPMEVRWQAAHDAWMQGYYYPPLNQKYIGEGAPPMIINVHSGPTYQVALDFPREAPFFNSRGYAWLDVNYRGSIGFGRAYQDALDGQWGKLDVEDVVSGAQEIVRLGLADESQLALYGGSSGGFTVLNALAKYPGRFRAAICRYPVTDLFGLIEHPDKFEAHTLDRLVGSLPGNQQAYKDRSPLSNAGKIQDPVIIFHGIEDKVVPLVQSEQIIASLQARGVSAQLITYEGEGHGFRKAENLEDCFNRIEIFLRERLLPEA